MQLIMSSSQLGVIQQPVVSLDLDITENGLKKMENIELSKEELSTFIASLENANKVSEICKIQFIYLFIFCFG